MKATIFVIASLVGEKTYKDTGHEIIPHFSYEQAKEMSDSGIISIQSHTYDMHQHPDYQKGRPREGVCKFKDEDEDDYIYLLRNDFYKSKIEIEAATGKAVNILAYPHGNYDKLSQAILWEMGVKVTLTASTGNNVIIKGLPQSLLGMNRFIIDNSVTADDLLDIIQQSNVEGMFN